MPTSGSQSGVLKAASPPANTGARAISFVCSLVDPFAPVRLGGRFFCARVRFPCRRRGPPAPAPLFV
jgi:hypothetical protein